MNPIIVIRSWLELMERRRLARIAEAAERERAAIQRAMAYRAEKHRAWKYLEGDLRNATCRALAAECGIKWRAKQNALHRAMAGEAR